jgi:hypothetical protein
MYKCYVCDQQINAKMYDCAEEFVCTCNKQICKKCNCDTNKHIYEIVFDDNRKYINVKYICINTILQNGTHHRIVYKDHDDYADLDAVLDIEDTNYVSILKELENLREENKRLKLEIEYRPAGIGYQSAKEHFEVLSSAEQKRV